MGVLQRFENRLEQLVSGAFARPSAAPSQPVEIAAALQREVDNSAQILSRDRRLVPEHLPRRALARRPRAARALRPDAGRGARRDAARARRRAALRLHRPGDDHLRPRRTSWAPAASGCAARRCARSRRGSGERCPTPPYAGRPWCSRSTACATRSTPPGWSSAGAPRPTCGSTTRGCRAATRRSACAGRPGADGQHRRPRLHQRHAR